MAELTNVTVIGSGVLGSQIAFQAAYFGKTVTVYDISEEIVGALPGKWEKLSLLYTRDMAATPEQLEAATSRLSGTTDLTAALADADIVIEAVPENLELKKKVWAQIGEAAPGKTVFCTNSSTLLPSDIAQSTGHPERFLALHFANEVWRNNTGEVMGHAGTDPAAVQAVLRFAEEIGMVPIHIQKEQAGYILNTLLVPFLTAASHLWVNDIAEAADIDRTWRTATGSPLGPFQILDHVGMETYYQINMNAGTEESQQVAERVKREFIDQGHMGRSSGQGFYTYE
ncbi:3-hydroxyacyl-CoA dehydrogenase [Kocuria rhizophila]|uniref:3-hydroxyacyl-CoA dehydrogenase n=1 Tax=Kocuria rhizophila TaxID=72000 RepID=UPI0038683394|nr:3-hydroxyacyl-CoA dehydrogenase [Kocuria rhizophila]WSZ53742.1 3-hydroxyacyl-CoA dehydrogenase [Kocuria rhizophila]